MMLLPKPKPRLLGKRAEKAAERSRWMRVRREVLARDHHMCRACGSSHGLEVHHVVMRSLGGNDTAENLIALCALCHRSVHGHVLVLRWNGKGSPAATVRFQWVK